MDSLGSHLYLSFMLTGLEPRKGVSEGLVQRQELAFKLGDFPEG